MDSNRALTALGVSLALGLLVGLQRERADKALAGFRTFALITLFGTVSAILSDALGGWVFAAGLLAIAAATAVGNGLRPRPEESPGITTEVAALLMFAAGAMLWLAPLHVGVALGVTCALLLHLKERLHAFAGRLDERDMLGIMQFSAVAFLILPLLPDRPIGPLNILNPRHIWWMVVLVVSISLIGYVALKLAGGRAGVILGGLIGGTVSSTAATASYARRAAQKPEAVPAALLAVLLAQCVLFARVVIEVIVVARAQARWIVPPILVLAVVSVTATLFTFTRLRQSRVELPESANPAELKSALLFALMYAAVLLTAAAAQRYLGASGVYAVAALSGMTDMDAITISSARLAAQGGIETHVAWRAIVLGIMSSTLFKLGLVRVLGGRAMLMALLPAAAVLLAAGALVLWLFPANLGLRWP